MLDIAKTMNANTLEIKLTGRLDTNTAKAADKEFSAALAEAAQGYALDCAALEYCSSAGLRAIKRLHQGARKKGAPLVLRNVQSAVMEVFELTGFAAMLKFE